MLLTSLKSYDRTQFVKDVTAGIIVAIIALPLSIALALASGVGPEAGIFTAIVAGFVISALGGSSVQIAGPTAAFATIVAGIVAKDGLDGLVISTILAGIFLILMGLCHFGSLIKFIPYTITTGFTSGIAVTIVIGQLKYFFGVTYPDGVKPIETTEKFKAFIENISTMNTAALIVGIVSLAILIISPVIFKKIPGSLIAVIVGILMVKFLPLKVSTIGNLYTISNSLPAFHLPAVNLHIIENALPNAFTIAVLAAIESLLSCVVADGMINGKHRSDMELVAQGAGNIASALFGGIPATGAIARTAANIKNGGRTPVAGMVHSITLVIVLVVLGLAGGIILVLASKFMAVYEDPRIAQITECLAGANCGGCGYAGCADYAKAIVENGAPTNKCAPGGAKATEAVNAIMGTESASGPALHAVVNCNGGNGNCGTRFEYHGIPTCAAAAAIAGGPSACAFGCLGYGDCTRACQFDAIHVVNGSAVVDREKCTGCSACVAACPHHVISLKPMAPQPAVLCSNKDKGPAVMKACKAGCIACGMCVRNCPQQAVTLVNNVAVIDYAKCSSCGTCVTKCPKKVIHWVDGQPAVAGEPA